MEVCGLKRKDKKQIAQMVSQNQSNFSFLIFLLRGNEAGIGGGL